MLIRRHSRAGGNLVISVCSGSKSALISRLRGNDGAGDKSLLWLRPPRVLLVEDHEINREVLQQLIEVAGCTVGVATNGEQAVERTRNGEWDLVFMDCQMPVVDGYEATCQIRSKASAHNAVMPIIALTAHVTVADRNRCLAAGMSDYLGKPCTLAEITSMLKKWLILLLSEGGRVDTVDQVVELPVFDEVAELSVMEAQRRQEAHDLRNFFTKIIGSAELALLKFDSPEEVRKYLEMILRETRKESARINK